MSVGGNRRQGEINPRRHPIRIVRRNTGGLRDTIRRQKAQSCHFPRQPVRIAR